MALNDFGLLGAKDDRAEEILGKYNKLEEFYKFLTTTIGATPKIATQIFLPNDDLGIFAFELAVTGINKTTNLPTVSAYGRFLASVTAAGVVTLPADADLTLVDLFSASAVTAVTLTTQNYLVNVRPAAVNINVTGVAAQEIIWSGTLRILSYCTRNTIAPLTQGISPTAPALT